MVEDKAIGIDLGGTRIRAALMDSDGNILARTGLATEAAQGLEHVLDRIELAINTVAETFNHSQIIGIGIGAPGPLNPKTGGSLFPAQLARLEQCATRRYFGAAYRFARLRRKRRERGGNGRVYFWSC